ncbi:hypothetical protein OHB41_03705 [Streptomyces sp. NBC_01571]|uniref:hypothetical protein n=1 Tax=Streptomyces sp. NBC_01571 TaxID=2975883 RepID=UPI00224E6967|nr:hypothetical protein [Streptomyces sp. NBC_01571]MCX4572304.1 hypothetical protein [Streptomyces sp. NBC_01571]
MCATAVRLAPDDRIRAPLWTWPPLLAKAVLTQRRRRFGIEDERILPAELTEEDDTP